MKKSIIKAYQLLLQTGNFDKNQLQKNTDRLAITAPTGFMTGNEIELILSVAKICDLLVFLTHDEEFKFSLM